jgi:hypothetical protein
MLEMGGIWARLRRRTEEDEFAVPAGDPEWRELLVRYTFRVTAAFLLLFGAVFFAFWWSGSAVRFGASRAAGQASPTWRLEGVVRDSITHEPIPWARVEDDPAGRLPLFQTDADQRGSFALDPPGAASGPNIGSQLPDCARPNRSRLVCLDPKRRGKT